ncbi:MAG TPA: LysO family transporter [Bacteroidales bacterium]|nr:LysO family transporter [Bacteroidales bacterium]
MLEIILIMAAGFVAGYLLRQKKKVVLSVNRLTLLSIYLLLFFLGFSIGGDPVVLDNLPKFGLNAFLITLGGVCGSILAAWATWTLFFQKTPVKE